MTTLADKLSKRASIDHKSLPRVLEGSAAYKIYNQDLCLVQFPSGSISTITHYHYINVYNSLTLEDKSRIKILRAQWLGDAKTFDLTRYDSNVDLNQVIAEEHAKSIAEVVRRYRANPNFRDLMIQKKDLDLEKGNFRFYRDWFDRNRGASSFTSKIIPALALERELPEIPKFVRAFDFETVFLPSNELSMVKKLLEEQPEPTYPPRILSEKDKQISRLFEIAAAKPVEADNELKSLLEKVLSDNAELKAKLEKLEVEKLEAKKGTKSKSKAKAGEATAEEESAEEATTEEIENKEETPTEEIQ